jgi:hypothetical protein
VKLILLETQLTNQYIPYIIFKHVVGTVIFLLLLLLILTANGVLPGGSGNTIRQNKQITHITQNNTTIKQNSTQNYTTKDTLHRMNTNSHNYKLIKNKNAILVSGP